MAQPLRWMLDWSNLSTTQRLLKGCPILGPERRVYADLLRQLNVRTPEDLRAWNTFPQEVQRTAERIAEIVKDNLGWPRSSVFLPDDPADIPFWDRWGDVGLFEVMRAVETQFGIEVTDEFWLGLGKMTFAEAISELLKAKKAEPCAGDNAAPPRAPV